jgi:hypothetical protein
MQHVICSTFYSTTVLKTNHLIMYKAKVPLPLDIRTKHSKQSEHHVDFLNIKPGGTSRNR